MGIISPLWRAPAVNPTNGKARSIPILNPVDKHGRVFFFSTFGFMIAFLSWYAFPPLLTKTIRADLKLSQNEVANSNVLGLSATLLVRIVIGPLCDRYGPRYCFAGLLLAGAIPTAMAGLVQSASGLLVLRFFIGVLGGTFVPCQVWSTGFYDRNVVGTANALTAGIGNAGGGITYFLMPAIFDFLVERHGLTPHKAWRVAFIVPFVLITATALGMLFLCEDTPTGPWSERSDRVRENVQKLADGVTVDATGRFTDVPTQTNDTLSAPPVSTPADGKKGSDSSVDVEIITQTEVIHELTTNEVMEVIFSRQCLMLSIPYACSFGGELTINSILGSYYYKNFHHLGQTKSGRWASMFGLLNVFFRPIGGIIADIIYKKTHSVWWKKHWLIFLGVAQGSVCLALGLINPHRKSIMFGLVAGLAFFMDAANEANFAVVPHVYPYANGVLSGMIGAAGNLGGVIFSIIFRYHDTRYDKAIWIMGVVMITLNIAVAWIRPVPKGFTDSRYLLSRP
ncbi:nitrate transporter [Choiromyces venosus 120613-1]|uniref:Nitrate/nitrite transporter n=1 Tax=Choiromyces venosus 120613-1 TaxID=1336337 RepID=A0A3N4JH55_9PEZI|nr:nitrate transporter [Choiromyces venosus 120613-1]